MSELNSVNIYSTANPMLDTSLLAGPEFHPSALTADGLFMYLSARLQNFDTRIDEIFKRQQGADKVRSILREISTQLARLNEHPENPGEMDNKSPTPTDTKVQENVNEKVGQLCAALQEIDPALGKRLWDDLVMKDDGLLRQIGTEGTYKGIHVKAAKELVGNISKDLDASAQLDMIQLQSLTSARQTAIGLATNLLSSLSETLRSIAANIGK